ncbi:unnamed protein product, partial [Ectocarpus sp. 13 AM-2016]
ITAGQIKAELDVLGVSYVGLLEKSEFVMKLAEAREAGGEKSSGTADTAAADAADAAAAAAAAAAPAAANDLPTHSHALARALQVFAMRVSAMKKELDERGVGYRGLFEKSEFVDLLVDARAKGITAPPPSSSG